MCTNSRLLTGSCPLGEGSDGERSGLAAAWQAARDANHTFSTWGGQPTVFISEAGLPPGNTTKLAPSPGSSEAAGGVRLRRQDTWVSVADGAAPPSEPPHRHWQGTATSLFLRTYGYLVDDLVGDDVEAAAQRCQWGILAHHAVSILQRCLTAFILGMFHYRYISATQVVLLITFHTVFIAYLLAVRPYASRLLLLADVVAYLCELTILAVAALLQRNPSRATHQKLTNALIACYFVDVVTLVVPEAVRCMLMAWAWLQARRQQSLSQGQVSVCVDQSNHIGRAVPAAGCDGVVAVVRKPSGPAEDAVMKAAATASLKLSVSGRNKKRC